MENRTVGYLILAIAILIAFMIFSFNSAMADIIGTSCGHGPECPMWGNLEFQTNVSLGLNIFVALIGIYLIFFAKSQTIIKKIIKPQMKLTKPKKSNYSDAIQKMSKEEKTIFEKFFDTDGPTYQADLVRDTGFSKVRITRILDRLESRDLIERKRRGMSNIVSLKR
ncbi:MAG: hypothetical protein GOV02_03300 [Candidatus Aenigmarchaeota archaeon]|nr:hypothetical protein [Candidatus Aenigmarchaeota archaeon]